MEMLNELMKDGSLLFAEISEGITWEQLKYHIEGLEQLYIMDFLTDGVTEAWLDFYYYGQIFSIHSPMMGGYLLYAKDHNCPAFMLMELIVHFRKLEGA